MIQRTFGGNGQDSPATPVAPQGDDTHDDDQGGKETIPDGTVPPPDDSR